MQIVQNQEYFFVKLHKFWKHKNPKTRYYETRTRKVMEPWNPNPFKPETCYTDQTRQTRTRKLKPKLYPNPKNSEPDPPLLLYSYRNKKVQLTFNDEVSM